MTNFSNKTVLLTGASGGFGQQFVRQLLLRDAQLILTDDDVDVLRIAADAIYTEVGRGEIVGCLAADLSTREGVDTLWDEVLGFGRNIDILINNAGIALLSRHDEVPPDAWERLLQINLHAPLRLCALATPHMIAQRSGHIVNIGSVASWTADVGLSVYAASKFGLRGFSETLDEELRPHNVKVSVVYPFFSNTAIIDSPKYGTLAQTETGEVDRSKLTDPAKIIERAVVAIEKDTLHIFPDKIGRIIYHFKRLMPRLFDKLKQRVKREDVGYLT